MEAITMKYSGYTTARMDNTRTAVAAMPKAPSPYLARSDCLGRAWLTVRFGVSVVRGLVVRDISASPQGRLVGPARNRVENEQQRQVEEGVEQADSGRVAELRLLQARVVDVGLDNLRG